MTENVILNEKQETVFDTDLSLAVDNLLVLLFQQKRIKEKLPDAQNAVIAAMKKNQRTSISVDGGPTFILEDKIVEKLKIINNK